MIKKLGEHIEVDTSESYNSLIWLIDDNVIIPYVNLLLLDRSSDLSEDFIDRSYLVFKGVKSLVSDFVTISFHDKLSTPIDSLVDYFMCWNDKRSNFVGSELSIAFSDSYLLLPDSWKKVNKSEGRWVPWSTPFYQSNMNETEVKFLTQKEEIPREFYEVSKLRTDEKVFIEYSRT